MGNLIDTLFDVAEVISPLPLAPLREVVKREPTEALVADAAKAVLTLGIGFAGHAAARYAMKSLAKIESHHLLPIPQYHQFIRVPGRSIREALGLKPSQPESCQSRLIDSAPYLLPLAMFNPGLGAVVLSESLRCMISETPEKAASLQRDMVRLSSQMITGMTAMYRPMLEEQSTQELLLDLILGPSGFAFH